MVSTSRTNIQLTKILFCCANERLTCRQCSVNAVKAQLKHYERRESAVKVSWERRASPTRTPKEHGRTPWELRCNALVALRTPWQALFHEKYQIFLPISWRSGKLNNSVPTQRKRGLVWQGLKRKNFVFDMLSIYVSLKAAGGIFQNGGRYKVNVQTDINFCITVHSFSSRNLPSSISMPRLWSFSSLKLWIS